MRTLAVVKVTYESGVAVGFTIPHIFSAETLDECRGHADSYIRSHLEIPSVVGDRAELIICEISAETMSSVSRYPHGIATSGDFESCLES